MLEVIATLIADSIRYNKDHCTEIEKCVEAFDGDKLELCYMIISMYNYQGEEKMDRLWILRNFGLIFGYDDITTLDE